MNWDDLKIALAIARAGSLTRAAEALGIDQTTAGRRLTALEGALGAVLFVRSRAGFAPTEAGEAVVARAVEIENRTMRLVDDLTPSGETAGVVRVAGGLWTIARVAAVVAPMLRARHPRLELRLIAGRAPLSLPLDEATVSLWFEAQPRDTEFAVKLGEAPYAVYAPAGVDPDAVPWLAHRNEAGPARAIDRWTRARLADGEAPAMTATDSLLLFEAARAGLGKAALPMRLAEGEPRLVRLDGPAPALTRSLHLHAHPDTIQLRRVQTVIETLRGAFTQIFGDASATDR